MRRLAIAGLFAVAVASLAGAQSRIIILVKPGAVPGIAGALLLENNTDILLLEDNASSFCLEGSC
jgi:hypothetical protein